MILYKNGLVLFNNKFQKLDFLVKDNIFFKIAENIENTNNFEVVNLEGKKVLPGLFDIHTHGAVGKDFNLASETDILDILNFYKSEGVTSVYPTVMTDSVETITNQLKKIAKIAKHEPIIKGIHLEGPFLNKIYKGAMPEEMLINPSIELFKAFNDASDNLIKIVTLAPELDGAYELIKYLNNHNIIASIGHSNATYKEAMKAIELGAKSFTHTFNAMRLTHQHEPGVMGAALMSIVYTEVICDGIHVNKDMVKLLLKNKGLDKVIAITDSMMAAGLGDGEFKLGLNAVTVKNGDALITNTNIRAGSTLTASKCLDNIVSFSGLSLEDAILTMTKNPAKMLGLDHITGEIKEGYLAEFIIK